MFTSEKGQDAIKGNRIFFLDNLRTFMIFLVVLCHAGWVYESSGIGAWFWIVDDPSTNNLSGILNLILDIFMIPTMFFISGYLTPISLKNKNRVGISKSEIQKIDSSLDYRCFNFNAALQSHIFILSKSTSGKLDYLLSL